MKLLFKFILVLSMCVSFVPAQAAWQVFDSKEKGNLALFQKDARTTKGFAAVGVMCGSDSSMLVIEWNTKFSVIGASIDGVDVKFSGQFSSDKNVQVLILEPGQVDAMIKGTNLELEAIPLLNEKSFGVASLIGFTKAVNQAGLSCI